MTPTSISCAMLCLLTVLLAATPSPAAQLAVADTDTAGAGTVRTFTVSAPWPERKPPLAVGGDAVLATHGNKLYVLSTREATLHVIARRDWEVRRTIALPEGSEPLDIVIVSRRRAYVTTRRGTHLLHVNPRSGAIREAVDFSIFADDDGVPDLGRMLVDGTRLFVQVRRANEFAVGGFAAPAFLGVVDLTTETLLDVDAVAPGVQAIQLEGTAAKARMQKRPDTNELIVSASGGFFDEGGLERVDLDTLSSLGLAIAEHDGLIGADLGPFVLLDSDRGYLVYSTDLTLSSHLQPFSFERGVGEGQNLDVSVEYAVPAMAYDSGTGFLFSPEAPDKPIGVHVFDTESDTRLSETPLATTGRPTDVLLLAPARAASRKGRHPREP